MTVFDNERARGIAGEVLRQLGGKRFIAMTGAKDFFFDTHENGDVSIVFKIGRNAKRVNYVKIAYDYSSDFYNVFFNCVKHTLSLMKYPIRCALTPTSAVVVACSTLCSRNNLCFSSL